MRGTKLALLAQNGPFWRIFRMHGELCTAAASNKPRMANFFVHKAQQHGDIETTDTTAIADTGQHETIITTAPENCTKNAHFSPAKATAVSTPHRHKCAKATEVSDNRAACPTGLGCSARGRRRGLAWLRGDAPSEARGADGSRAGRRPPTHTAARPIKASHAAAGTPAGSRAGRRPPTHTAARPIKASHAAAGTPAGSRAGRRPRAHRAARPHSRARRRPQHPWDHKQQARIKTPTRNRVGVSEPPVGIEPTTYSLRVNRSAD